MFQRPAPTAWVVVQQGEQAVFVTTDDPSQQRTWTVPGGFIEIEESAAAAAVRELAEETGLRTEPSALRVIRTGHHMERPEEGAVLSICFAVAGDRVDGEVAPRNEIAAARWCLPEWFDRPGETLQSVDRQRYEAAFSHRRLRGKDGRDREAAG